jgi:hypothetical protein
VQVFGAWAIADESWIRTRRTQKKWRGWLKTMEKTKMRANENKLLNSNTNAKRQSSNLQPLVFLKKAQKQNPSENKSAGKEKRGWCMLYIKLHRKPHSRTETRNLN